jgi:GNAT superfamily N-acetyltransferase
LEKEEVVNNFRRVQADIEGTSQYDTHFWVIKSSGEVMGIAGLSDCQPKLQPYIASKKPKEIKTVFVDRKYQRKGLGQKLLNFLEDEVRKQGCQQLLLVSAEKFQDTAYGFYEVLGFKQQGWVPGGSLGKRMAVFTKEIGQ